MSNISSRPGGLWKQAVHTLSSQGVMDTGHDCTSGASRVIKEGDNTDRRRERRAKCDEREWCRQMEMDRACGGDGRRSPRSGDLREGEGR